MVDASNAFNNINREATIHNIKVKCPALAKYVENTYKLHTKDQHNFLSTAMQEKTAWRWR